MKSNDQKTSNLYKNETTPLNNEKGIIFISVIALLAVLTILGVVAVTSTTTDIKISSNYKRSKQAFYAAESGAEYKFNQLRIKLNNSLNNPDINSIAEMVMPGYTFNEDLPTTYGTQTNTSMTMGNFVGLTSFGQRYKIDSEAFMTGTNTARAKVTLLVDDDLIPLFQFAVFYENDLEILPGQDMVISGSRIHSNNNIYFAAGAGKKLSIDAKTSSAGNIFNYRKDYPLSTMDGTVEFEDASDVYQAMAGLDSTSTSPDPEWATEALLRWGGEVKSQDHGINQLNLPLPDSSTAIDIIKPGEVGDTAEIKKSRYYWKAGLRIMDGVATDKDGNNVDLTSGGAENPLSTETFYDQREGKPVTVTTIDMAKLQSNINAMAALNNETTGNDPGILYIQETASNNGIRLINGSLFDPDIKKLPEGFTLATENPLYIQGDYNVDNRPASVAADAITILSNDWNDTDSQTSEQSLSNRIASSTIFNAAIITGHMETTVGSQYSGGVENLPRFLEDWSTSTLTYRGSLISLWLSAQATGNWEYGGKVYKAPIRNWLYGININNLPPGTPNVRQVQKGEWYSTH